MSIPLPSLRAISIAALALSCALIAAMIVLPARWLMLALPADAIASIADAHGTVWNGSAQIALGPEGARTLLPQPVKWQWHKGAIEVSHPWLRGPVRIQPSWSGMKVSAQNLRAPATVLQAFGAPLNTIAPGGQISIDWQGFVIGHLPENGTLATARWTHASSALAHIRPLGDYRLDVSAKGAAVQLTLSTESGVLSVSGQGSLKNDRIDLQGIARPADSATDAQRASLTGLLSALGPVTNGQSRFGTPR